MQLSITSLNSGSNGNCYYIGNETEAVLVDAGISCRETERRMQRLGLSMNLIKAIFVSHEHSDHIQGIGVLAKKYRLPVYITDATLRNSRLRFADLTFISFQAYQPVQVGELRIMPFPKLHDAADPHSFVVTCRDIKIGVFTDIGAPCQHVKFHFRQCRAAFLEANYDDEMLDNGYYPHHLKRRIKGNKGHLSNRQALELFMGYKPEGMSHLLLSHLSKDNNCPILAKDFFATQAGATEVIVASRFHETPVFTFTCSGQAVRYGSAAPKPKTIKKPSFGKAKPVSENQLSLF